MFRSLTRKLFYRKSVVAKSLPIVRFSHGDPIDDENLTGFKRIFNGETVRGRANFAKLYMCMWAVIFVIYKVRKGMKAKSESTQDSSKK